MRLFTWLFFATLSIILFLQRRGFDADLHTPESPRGIIGYEMAWTSGRANEIIASWRRNAVIEEAKVRLGVDFAFVLAYPLWLATGVGLLLNTGRSRSASTPSALTRSGSILYRAVLVCIPLDIVKNLLLWRMLNTGASDFPAHLATLCAIAKFLVVAIVLLWTFVALAHRLRHRGAVNTVRR